VNIKNLCPHRVEWSSFIFKIPKKFCFPKRSSIRIKRKQVWGGGDGGLIGTASGLFRILNGPNLMSVSVVFGNRVCHDNVLLWVARDCRLLSKCDSICPCIPDTAHLCTSLPVNHDPPPHPSFSLSFILQIIPNISLSFHLI